MDNVTASLCNFRLHLELGQDKLVLDNTNTLNFTSISNFTVGREDVGMHIVSTNQICTLQYNVSAQECE